MELSQKQRDDVYFEGYKRGGSKPLTRNFNIAAAVDNLDKEEEANK